tara:strand:+ start:127 stop:489 length:363 start_codon:yes stop_codon:yes gene_type:complete
MKGIYGIKDKAGTIVYVGQSTNIKGRWKQHYKKYAESEYTYEILWEDNNATQEILDQREIFWIRGVAICNHEQGYEYALQNIKHNPYPPKTKPDVLIQELLMEIMNKDLTSAVRKCECKR